MSRQSIVKIAEALKRMTKVFKPPGSPKIWEVVEKTNKDGRSLKFTIQDIPEERNEEAVEHMCKYFLADEPTCACFNAANTPLFVEETKVLWQYIAKQGIAIAAFTDNPKGGKPIMAGVNMLCVEYKDDNHEKLEFQSKFKITFEVMSILKDQVQLYERYGVDKYLYAVGLSVDPSFRGYGLGTDILKARDKIGREYNLGMTATIFTSPFSARAAKNAGFEVLFEKKYTDLVDENGKEYFPGIQKFSQNILFMAKRL